MLVAVTGALLLLINNRQSMLSVPGKVDFTGEYSRDYETWLPLIDSADIQANDGELWLRGHIDPGLDLGGRLNFFVDHIGYSIYVNGAAYAQNAVIELEGKLESSAECVRLWDYIVGAEIKASDDVEIHLFNPHCFGNKNAYRDFIATICVTPNITDVLNNMLKPYCEPFELIGTVIIIAALLLMGAAGSAVVLRVKIGGALLKFGVLSAFAGGFFILDTANTTVFSNTVALKTYGFQVCMMLFTLWLAFCVPDSLSGGRKKLAKIIMWASALVDVVLIMLSITGAVLIYDTIWPWALSQFIMIPPLIACCVLEIRHGSDRAPYSYMLVFITVLLDLAGVGASMYSHGTCTKAAFVLVFALYMIKTVALIIKDYQGAARAEKMEKELEDNRISIMLSQIQPHFLYNALTTIKHLCRQKDPRAEGVVTSFAKYLRGNMDSLTNKEPIPFTSELAHLESYLAIERLRFPKVNIVYDIAAENFLLPALTVQPMVENAIRYGVTQKESGEGSVKVSSWEDAAAWYICIADDGVGFDAAAVNHDGRSHIGISNTKARLGAMCSGELSIQSEIGVGTRVTIKLPKSGAAEERALNNESIVRGR